MNKSLLSISVFLLLMFSALVVGHYSYSETKSELTADLNQALSLSLAENARLFSTDTINACRKLRDVSDRGMVQLTLSNEAFRRRLKHKVLCEHAFLAFNLAEGPRPELPVPDDVVCSSDTMVIGYHTDRVALRGYVRLSEAAVFGLSDQRLSSVLAILAFVWAVFSWSRNRTLVTDSPYCKEYGGLYYVESECCFYDIHNAPLRLTPMQHELLLLFWNAPNHRLLKTEICAALWPKKDDANNTLYALVKRLRPMLEAHSKLHVVAHRDRGYSLEINDFS